ncbi:MAG TPA: DUF2232 domain-containing protein [Methylomirabilota bacterium]|nr:DUF2232 domain-containing protein [Methylomirabilota bacterium]
MDVSPEARRAVLLGAGMGLGLAGLETAAAAGWWGGFAAIAVGLVPVAIALALGGPLAAALASGVAMTAIGAVRGGPAMLVVGLKYALPGAALGFGLARQLPIAVTTLLTALGSLVGVVVLLWALSPAGVGPIAYLERQVAAQVAELEQWPARLGPAGQDAGWATDAARFVVATLRVAALGMLGLGVFAGAVANYAVARFCLRRRVDFRPFAQEAVPDHCVWGAIGAGVLLASRQERLEAAGLNLLLVLMPLYVIQGLAVFRHFFQRIGLPRLLQVVSFGLLAMQPLLLVAVSCIGLSDLWIDFRKIRQAPTAASG